MKKVLVALALALGFLVAVPPAPAQASCTFGVCGVIVHYSPDDGYDAPFLVACNWKNGGPIDARYVYEGQRSTQYCPDVDGVYVNSGAKIICMTMFGWAERWGATGWHQINDQAGGTCVYQLD